MAKKKKNPGKDFENDLKKSADDRGIFCLRLKDPAASFGQTDGNLRFSLRNLCDFVMFEYPSLYLAECKSHLKSAVPFKALKSSDSDNRIKEMSEKSISHKNVNSFVIFNWRDHDNFTVAVPATLVDDFIKTEGRCYGKPRKSIPFLWTREHGFGIKHRLKKVHYEYLLESLITIEKYDPEVQP